MNAHRDELPRTLPKFAVNMYIYTHIHTHIYIYIHTHAYIHILKFSTFNLLSRKISSWLLPDNSDIKNFVFNKDIEIACVGITNKFHHCGSMIK